MEIIAEPGTTLFLLILVTGGLIFYNLKINNLQEFARIEHGLSATPKDPNRLKKMGILFISIGIGILLGYYLGNITSVHPLVTIPSMILIMGGISLMLINQLK